MEASRKRNIQSGAQYDHLFVKAALKDYTVKKGATVSDTVRFIPKVVRMKRWQTQRYVNSELKGLPVQEACKKLWHFLYDHVAYKKDETGLEQIRSPARVWHDRVRGVDCDCYTTFISCVLTNLGIPHRLRIAKYSEDHFQHIYPVVPMDDGSYITIDCVVNEFNYEEPYTEIKDTNMDLQLLDGIDEPEQLSDIDDEVYGIEEDELGQLGWSLKKSKAGKFLSKSANFIGNKVIVGGAKKIANAGVKVGQFTAKNAKKGVHLINRFNPGTVLLRNGLLAAMKLNMFNVAGNLRLSYLNDQDAGKRNLNPSKFNSLVNIRKKVENIFYAAGGNESNLKKAILTGKGNQGQDKVLAGLDGIEDTDFGALSSMDENTSLYQLLGPELFASSNVISEDDLNGLSELDSVDGLNGICLADQYYVGQELTGLGEPATVSVAAASGAVATIAALIKNIGNLYDKGKAVADNLAPVTDVVKAIIPSNASSTSQEQSTQEEAASAMPPPPEEEGSPPSIDDNPESNVSPTAKEKPPTTAVAVNPSKEMVQQTTQASTSNPLGFWDKHKKWLKPTLIGAGGLGLLYLGYSLLTGKKEKPPSPPVSKGLSGIKGKKKKKANGKKQQPIALM